MRTAFVCCLLGSLSVTPFLSHADDGDSGISAKDIKTLFFGQDDRILVTNPAQPPWDAIGQLETASGNLCTAMDTVAHGIPLENAVVGNLLVFENAGAYAAALSPHGFSSQPEAKEILWA